MPKFPKVYGDIICIIINLNGVHVNEFHAPHFVKLIFNLYNSAILPYLLCNIMILEHILHEQAVGKDPTNCECRTGLWEYVSTEQSIIDF